MSLVAYENSDEDSCDEFEIHLKEKEAVHEDNSEGQLGNLKLPKPKINFEKSIVGDQKCITDIFSKPLPTPITSTIPTTNISEEDDEFLYKKAEQVENPPPPIRRPVQIFIPSLRDFNDVEKDLVNSAKNKINNSIKSKSSGLLSILPKAKSEQNFAKLNSSVGVKSKNYNEPELKPKTAFIPDTVKTKRSAHNTEGIDRTRKAVLRPSKEKIGSMNLSDSDDSADETSDFFALSSKSDQLPIVSANEINALVATRAAKISEASDKYFQKMSKIPEQLNTTSDEDMVSGSGWDLHDKPQLDASAVKALVGSQAKRRRLENIEVVDISSDHVLPNHNDWMRTALASSTAYQPTGVLVDEEPAAGTRRKHQITYLAHKAKANEAELQAMWSANRQNRRATQSKYGF